MKSSPKIISASLFLAVFILPLSLMAQKKDWREWSQKDAQKVVFKATRAPQTGMGESFGVAVSGAMTGLGKMSKIQVTWLTDPAVRGLVRATQINERLTDEEASNLYEKLKGNLKDFYGFSVSAPSMLVFQHGPILLSEDAVETGNPNRIFLQYPHDQKIFLRPVRIEKSLSGVQSLSSLLRVHSEQEVIILFPKDPKFMENSGGEVEFQMLQKGKERKVKFKIKDLAEDPGML